MTNDNSNFENGRNFEKFVQENLFPPNQYDLKSVSPDVNNRFVQDNLNPDLKLARKGSAYEFWVECKFCGNSKIDILTFSAAQLLRYSNLEEHVIYMVGFGGSPDNPKIIFSIPMSEILPKMEIWKLKRYLFNVPLKFNKNYGQWGVNSSESF